MPEATASGVFRAFLFSDIEGSTKLWERAPAEMRDALRQHNELLSGTVREHLGSVFKTVGDGFCCVFQSTADAVKAALDIQRLSLEARWPTSEPIRIRIAIHAGEVEELDGDYFGPTLNLVSRMMAVTRGGHTLLSEAVVELAGNRFPSDASPRDLGEYVLRDIPFPVRLFQLVHPSLPADYPLRRGIIGVKNNLPVQLTSFVGREEEILEIEMSFQRARLLTLVGPGGVGKTRLSVQIGERALAQHADGVWFVELAELSDASLLPQAVASPFHLRDDGERSAADLLADYLRTKSVLLVLDNCEHLIDACATFVDALMRRCPRVKILATSREPLDVPGEVVWRVPTMPIPNMDHQLSTEVLMQYDAIRLFTERSTARLQSFRLTQENAPSVARICKRLDGIPLAIELAAARVASLEMDEIVERLERALSLLTTGPRTLTPRQKTLRGAIDWSYDLLSPAERALFRRLGAFSGTFSMEAVEQVALEGEVDARSFIDLMTSLFDKSLIVTTEGVEEKPHFRMLDTLREYATEKLAESGEETRVRRRHYGYFLSFAKGAEPKLSTGAQRLALVKLNASQDNFRAALSWCREVEDVEAGLRLCVSLSRFWQARGFLAEGRGWLESYLSSASSVPADLLAEARLAAGSLACLQGDHIRAGKLCEESLVRFRATGSRRPAAEALRNIAEADEMRGDYASADSRVREALDLAMESDDREGMGEALLLIGCYALRAGKHDVARRSQEESLRLFRELDHRRGAAKALNVLGLTAWETGRYAEAHAFYSECLELFRDLGDRKGVAVTICNLGELAHEQGEYPAARALLNESLSNLRELGDRKTAAYVLNNLGELARHEGAYESAISLLREGIDEARALEDRRGMAVMMVGVGLSAVGAREFDKARAAFRESYDLLTALADRSMLMWVLEGSARLAAETGELEPAAKCFAAADAFCHAAGVPLPPVDREVRAGYRQRLAAALGEERTREAEEKGKAMPLEDAISYLFEMDRSA